MIKYSLNLGINYKHLKCKYEKINILSNYSIKNTAKRNIKPLISGTEKMTAPHVWPWKYTTIKPLLSGTADMTYSQIVWLYDPFSHMPPQYLQYKSCRLHLLYVVFNLCACRISHLILLPRAHHSISGLNVNYPFPVFPHSVSDLWSEQS